MRTLVPLLFVLAAACGTTDADEDGYPENVDCSDHDPHVNPGAVDVCNGIDDDCSGAIDDVLDPPVWYADADGDRWGDEDAETRACFAPAGTVDAAGDCDDANPAVHPTAAENDCTDPTDYNCDGSTGFADADADGFPACEDCDDLSAARNPGATEVCNDLDDDCDGATDDDDPGIDASTQATTYADTDGDSYGDADARTISCDTPSGNVADATDCDDTNAAVSPVATETCNGGVDDDCDGTADGDDASGKSTFYADADADGHGDATKGADACVAPSGYVPSADDCDDTDPKTYAGAPETCDDVDDDCDGEIDEDPTDSKTWYADTDKDLYGDDATATVACDAPDGFVGTGGDCDDTRAGVRPGTPEACNGLDDNCDGSLDEGFSHATFYVDADGDGAGHASDTLQACAAPPGFAKAADDCNDADAAVVPGADEGCTDGIDNNCDELTDCDDIDGCKEIDEACWVCGDKVVDPDETCDDGNRDALDGCDSDCQSEFTTATFTTCGAIGNVGPGQSQCDNAYKTTELAGDVSVNGGIQAWKVPVSGTFELTVAGARGGFPYDGNTKYGFGAVITSRIELTRGEVIHVLVGQHGTDTPSGETDWWNSSGGGGTFVFRKAGDTNPIMAAGGGGGGSYSQPKDPRQDASVLTNGQPGINAAGSQGAAGGSGGSGGFTAGFSYGAGAGGGWRTDGSGGTNSQCGYIVENGRAPRNGGIGGRGGNAQNGGANYPGGFGGGGGGAGACGSSGAGGGGGYSGGGVGGDCCTSRGGGGGSYSSAPILASKVDNKGDGYVVVTFVP